MIKTKTIYNKLYQSLISELTKERIRNLKNDWMCLNFL